jgi:hypothetical protein
VAAIPNASGPAPPAAVESSGSAAAGAGDLAPPRRQHLGLHCELRLLDALVAAFRAADADQSEADGIALCQGVAEHAQLGADRIGEHRHGDEAPLVELGTGTTTSSCGLKKL